MTWLLVLGLIALAWLAQLALCQLYDALTAWWRRRLTR